jgi:hypothetical protein
MANFMSAQTEIDGVVEKLEACNNKAANIIAELCVSKANDGSLKDNTYIELMKLVSNYPAELQARIFAQAIVVVSKQLKGSVSTTKVKSDSARSGFFKHK